MGDQSVGSTEYNNEWHDEEDEDGDSDVVVIVVVVLAAVTLVVLLVVVVPVRVQEGIVLVLRSTRTITGAACGYMRGISN